MKKQQLLLKKTTKQKTFRALESLPGRDQLFECLLVVIFFTRYLRKQRDIHMSS